MHRNLGKYIDHSPLCSDITHEDIIKFCDEAKTYGFCSVVVHPIYISTAFKELSDTDIKVVSVAGFPFGTDFTDMKAMETQRWISYGATEIDMVMNIGALKEKNYDYVRNDIKEVVNAADKKAGIKVIIETALLTDDEKVIACKLAAEAGASFVKTSTGFLRYSKPATVEDVKLMYETVKNYGLEVKASGGIKDTQIALDMINAGATRLGTTSGIDIVTSKTLTTETVY